MVPPSEQRIVVVEDDDAVRTAIERVLRIAGWRLRTFVAAEDMLAAGMSDIACMVVDVRLPGISGYALIDTLTKRGPLPPVLYISSHFEQLCALANTKGTAHRLAKPFTADELIDSIKSAIAGGDWRPM